MNGLQAPPHSHGVSMSSLARQKSPSAVRLGAGGDLVGKLKNDEAASFALAFDEDLSVLESAANSATLSDMVASVLKAFSEKEARDQRFRNSASALGSATGGRFAGSKFSLEEPDQVYAQGQFAMHAKFNPWHAPAEAEIISIAAEPEQWIIRPGADWVMIGFEGTIERTVIETKPNHKKKHAKNKNNDESPEVKEGLDLADQRQQHGGLLPLMYTLEAVLVDVERVPLPSCSKLQATLMLEATDHVPSWDVIFSGSVWKGQYVCAGLPTEVELKLSRESMSFGSSALPPGELQGTFQFTAKTPGSRLQDSTMEQKSMRLTEAGCKCKPMWEASYKQNGKLVKEVVRDAACANPGDIRVRDYCMIEQDTCKGQPASQTWDYCVHNWRRRYNKAQKTRANSPKLTLKLDGDIPVLQQQEDGFAGFQLSVEDFKSLVADLTAQADEILGDLGLKSELEELSQNSHSSDEGGIDSDGFSDDDDGEDSDDAGTYL